MLLIIIIPIFFSCASAPFYNERGIAYGKKGHYDEAISDFTKSLEIKPSAEAYNNRGVSYSRKGQNDEAISDYSKAIEINLKYVKAYNLRAWEYTLKGQYDQAISDLNKALEINPRDPEIYNNLAWVLATANAPAFRDGKKALELALKTCELSDWKNLAYLDTRMKWFVAGGRIFQRRGIWISFSAKKRRTEDAPIVLVKREKNENQKNIIY
jgi:tetratricopeptide (TPR) repeat protein